MVPSVGSINPRISSIKVVFPDPEGPVMPMNSPRLITALTPESATVPSGYENPTLFKRSSDQLASRSVT
jgi:hypothetical protein